MSLQTDDLLSLPILLAWLRANWIRIVFGGVVCALLAIPVILYKTKTYDSTATLLVSPPMFKDRSETSRLIDPTPQVDSSIAGMMPRALPVEAYKAIALSAPLLDEVIRRVPLETGILDLQDRLRVELIRMDGSGTRVGSMYTQALMFHAQADSPELAAKTAQTWAEVFKEQVDAVAAEGIKETSSLLADLHDSTKTELELASLALAEHQKAWNLGLNDALLSAKQGQFTSFEGELKQTEVDLASGEKKLKALEEEFAKEPEKNVYFRAPSDDAYWITGLQNGGEPKIEPDWGLRTEQSNPNYVRIRASVVDAKTNLEGLRATKDTILVKLGELDIEMKALTAEFSDKTVERDQLTRESQSLKTSYVVVRAEYEKGRMADQTQASDIVIAGKAVPVDQPTGWGSAKTLVVAAFVGMLMTGTLLILKRLSEVVPLLGAEAGGLGAFMIRDSGPAPDGPSADTDPAKTQQEQEQKHSDETE